MIYIGVMGHGVVGSGTVEILHKNKDTISKRTGRELVVKKILDIQDFDVSYRELFTKDASSILEDEDISIIVEAIGGIDPAYEYTVKALKSGKHVVTSNKELVAQHGSELLNLAKENNVNYLFEASVGGGIPIIRPLRQCLAANKVSEIYGILNGTTNYILTRMKRAGLGFDEALKEAQIKGYAEADPTADVKGHDAGRKIAILSSIAFGKSVPYAKIYTEGIDKIDHIDILYANKLKRSIKLIARAKRHEDGVFAMVTPVLVDNYSPMADVENVFNAIMVKGDAIGDVMFYGQGAGKLPTASAVVGDIIDVVKHLNATSVGVSGSSSAMTVLPINNFSSRRLIRLSGNNLDIVNKYANEVFKNSTIIDLDNAQAMGEIAILTDTLTEGEVDSALKLLKKKVGAIQILGSMRVE
ncbi:MAG: homoserine dehydrogenase [Clostridiales bacterium]|nr:homoserine dehydrogenase [Clostridiales bacterium]